MKTHLVLIMLIISGFITAIAQTSEEKTDVIPEDQILQTGNSMFSPVATIQQQGIENNSIFIQTPQDPGFNEAIIQQSGIHNNGYIQQTGADLSSHLLQQGQNNEANLWSEGGHIDIDARQTGSDNVIYSYIKNPGIFEKQAILHQDGNNNRIELALFGNVMPTADQLVTIIQQGDDFEAKALMESYNYSIGITQKEGPGGGDMKVDVSVSDFSFPMR